MLQKNVDKIEVVKAKLITREKDRERMQQIRTDMHKLASNQKEELNEKFAQR